MKPWRQKLNTEEFYNLSRRSIMKHQVTRKQIKDSDTENRMDTKITLEFKNDISELDRLIHNLEQFCLDLSLPMETMCQMELAMEEVFTNTISYGYTDNAVHRIKFAVSCNKELLIMEMEDDGIPFNPLCIKKPDISCPIESREQGGLGFYLVRRFMDDIAYVRLPNKNHLVMKKRIKGVQKNNAFIEHSLGETKAETV